MDFDLGKLGQSFTEAAAEYAVELIEAAEAAVAQSPEVVVRPVMTGEGGVCAEREIVYEPIASRESIVAAKQTFKKYAAVAKTGIRGLASSLWVSQPTVAASTPSSKSSQTPQSESSQTSKTKIDIPQTPQETPIQKQVSDSRPPAFNFASKLPMEAITEGIAALSDATVSTLDQAARVGGDAAWEGLKWLVKNFPTKAVLNFGLCRVGPRLLPPYRYYAVAGCGALSVWNSMSAVDAYNNNKSWFNGAMVLVSVFNLAESLQAFQSISDGAGMGISSSGSGGEELPGLGTAGSSATGNAAASGGADPSPSSSSGGDLLAQAAAFREQALFGTEGSVGNRFLGLVEARVSNEIESLKLAGLNEADFSKKMMKWFNEMDGNSAFSGYEDSHVTILEQTLREDPRRFIRMLRERSGQNDLEDFFKGLFIHRGEGSIISNGDTHTGTSIAGEIGVSLSVDGQRIR